MNPSPSWGRVKSALWSAIALSEGNVRTLLASIGQEPTDRDCHASVEAAPCRTAPKDAHHGPGLLNVLARSPAALAGYLGLHHGLAQGRLTEVERCLIGLMVGQRSGSAYWLSVQSRQAEKAGLTKDRIQAAREGCGDSDRRTALLFLAGRLVINRGELAEADLAAVRQAGLCRRGDHRSHPACRPQPHRRRNRPCIGLGAGFPAGPALARVLRLPA